MNERQNKLLDLSKYYEILATAEANSPQMSARAAELARELFPPMAKALLWIGDRDIENEYLVRSQDRTGANWHAFVKGVFIGIGSCADEAKAMCEANNQARFLEMIA